ncbi:MAG: hypothetical protein ACK56F_04175, partial [bacterium]
VVATTAVLAVAWWATCSFYVGPQLYQAAMAGKIKQEPKVCDNVEDRALQVLTGLLATLLGLMSNPPSNPEP